MKLVVGKTNLVAKRLSHFLSYTCKFKFPQFLPIFDHFYAEIRQNVPKNHGMSLDQKGRPIINLQKWARIFNQFFFRNFHFLNFFHFVEILENRHYVAMKIFNIFARFPFVPQTSPVR